MGVDPVFLDGNVLIHAGRPASLSHSALLYWDTEVLCGDARRRRIVVLSFRRQSASSEVCMWVNWQEIVEGVQPLDAGWATLIAGFAALLAGVLAYKGAMVASRDATRRANEDDERRRRNLYLKAEHMAYNLTELSKLALYAAQLEFSAIRNDIPVPGTRPAEELRVQRPAELSELWNSLSDFAAAPGAIRQIRDITRNFDATEAYLSQIKVVPDSGQSPLAAHYIAIREAAFLLGDIMAGLTEPYSRDLEDRGERLYGSPDPDE
ncbi:MAG: hypothetical protein WDN04_08855 [Rhodospirillales bacterium]